MQVSIGRLGVITAVTFKIVPNNNMRRRKFDVGLNQFLDKMKRVQDGYNSQGDASPAGTAAHHGTCSTGFLSVCARPPRAQCKTLTAPCSAGAQPACCWRVSLYRCGSLPLHRRFITRRYNDKAMFWESHVNWDGPAPAPAAAWSLPHVQTPVPGALTDAQLAAALASGKEPPITRQPLYHSQRGAPLTFQDLGAHRGALVMQLHAGCLTRACALRRRRVSPRIWRHIGADHVWPVFQRCAHALSSSHAVQPLTELAAVAACRNASCPVRLLGVTAARLPSD